ncbi:bestrophin family ion channel [uncultured Chitinophaga sp.]|jgi:Predicted membrane protein|uniref:bestrophin family protein n=1 Tax=uncultured Chitinophaga sp. TaxID=339340 RepID=UPI002638B405|nr:bestrophin family ion channel [uncultured Chitinophaga sp.]
MHVGKSYKLSNFIYWTRRNLYVLLVLGVVPVLLYHLAGLQWLAIPWTVVAMLGTATAFIVGFKNSLTYNRTWTAGGIWTNIINGSRAWAILSRDYLHDPDITRVLYNRHFAWLTALRFQLREDRIWEVTDNMANSEYQQYYAIPERQTTVDAELAKYLQEEDLAYIAAARNKAAQILSLQGLHIQALYDNQTILLQQFMEMQRSISNLYTQQGLCESFKNTPYPRQYSIMNTILVRIFCFLLPFGLLHEFDKLNSTMNGLMKGHMIWLVIPFSVLISWLYTSLEQVGESTENPFEGSPNDVPISQICRTIEIEMRQMIGDRVLPAPLAPQNDILV